MRPFFNKHNGAAAAARRQALREHFMQCGEIVRADVFTERSGAREGSLAVFSSERAAADCVALSGGGAGRSRGCGIVEFATEEEVRTLSPARRARVL